MNAGIVATGKFIPSKKINNLYVSKKTKLSKKEILKKTGIRTRYFVNTKETASLIAYNAAKQALKRSKII